MVVVEARLIDLGLNASGDRELYAPIGGDIVGVRRRSKGRGTCARGSLDFLTGRELIELALMDFRWL